MELTDVINKRQSIRWYKDEDVSNEDIRKIVEAAGKAPSGKNIQNWYFVAIKNRKIMEQITSEIMEKNEEICLKMDEVDEAKANRFRKFAKNFTAFVLRAPVLVVVMTEVYKPSGYREYELINAPAETLDDLINYRSPGMQSLGAGIENFTLKAIDLGYGTCWLTSANYAADRIERIVRDECGFDKENYYLGAMISLGVPADEGNRSPKKKDVDTIYKIIE